MACAADSKFSNRHVTFELNSNRDVRFELTSRSFAGPYAIPKYSGICNGSRTGALSYLTAIRPSVNCKHDMPFTQDGHIFKICIFWQDTLHRSWWKFPSKRNKWNKHSAQAAKVTDTTTVESVHEMADPEACTVHTAVFSGSLKTQLRWSRKLHTYSQSRIFRMYINVPNTASISSISSSCRRLHSKHHSELHIIKIHKASKLLKVNQKQHFTNNETGNEAR